MPSSSRGTARRGLALAALALIAAVGCDSPAPPSIVLITLDTTRADHLGPYGYARAETPHLDRFAATATLYERAYATSPWTLPSHASIFTGLLPMQHGAQSALAGAPDGVSGVVAYPVRPLGAHFETLAERLGGAGYRTAAVVGGPALAHELGVGQGFAYYEDDLDGPLETYTGKRAEEVADLAIHYLERFEGEPFFLFVNFYDPHGPYRPPPPFDRNLPEVDDAWLAHTFVEHLESGVAARPVSALPAAIRAALKARIEGYDAEITYMDRHLGRLLAALESSPIGDRAWVVITSDHGESFGEHYFISHGANLYEHDLRVPLLLRAPGQRRGERLGEPVQNHRLFPTLLAAAGLAVPTSVGARPLGPNAPPGAIVTELRRNDASIRMFGDFFARDLRAIHLHPYKLIVSSTGALEIFDVERDPGELEHLVAGEALHARDLSRRLERIERSHPPLFEARARAQLAPATEETLRALGYLD